LLKISGLGSRYGDYLMAGGAACVPAALLYAARGGAAARWALGLLGASLTAFSGYLLIELTRDVGRIDGMAVPSAQPGLYVVGAGALVVLLTMFLPHEGTPGGNGGRGEAAVATAPPLGASVLATAVTAVRASDARNRARVALGVVWLVDAALQFQPFMFTRSLATQTITGAAAGSPGWVAGPVTSMARLIGEHPAAWNEVFALTQLALAVGILTRRTAKVALAASIVWAAGVWSIGESFGGVLAPGANPLMGTPGAVLLYAVIAVLVWPRATTSSQDDASPAPRFHPARLIWAAVWALFAGEMLAGSVRSGAADSSMLSGMAGSEPGWLASLDRATAGLFARDGLALAVTLSVLFLVVAAGALIPRLCRPTLVLAGVLSVGIWVIGENLGGLFTGQATDVNTGPLLVLLAAMLWSRSRRRPERPASPSVAAGRQGQPSAVSVSG
jgi:hypothetical protein